MSKVHSSEVDMSLFYKGQNDVWRGRSMGRRSRGRKEGLVTFFPIHSSLHVCCSVRLIGRGIRDPIEREWGSSGVAVPAMLISLNPSK